MSIPDKLKKTGLEGKKALIIGTHPFAGKVGICIGAYKGPFGWYMAFKTVNTGERFGVSQPANITWIEERNKK